MLHAGIARYFLANIERAGNRFSFCCQKSKGFCKYDPSGSLTENSKYLSSSSETCAGISVPEKLVKSKRLLLLLSPSRAFLLGPGFSWGLAGEGVGIMLRSCKSDPSLSFSLAKRLVDPLKIGHKRCMFRFKDDFFSSIIQTISCANARLGEVANLCLVNVHNFV